MATVGTILQEKRESLNLTLIDVADATNLSVNFLAAIEKNEFHVLPRGIFPKMFIKTYATHVGLNGEELVSLYYEQIAQSDQEVPKAEPLLLAAPSVPESKGDFPLRKILAVVALLALMGVVLYFTSPFGLFEKSKSTQLPESLQGAVPSSVPPQSPDRMPLQAVPKPAGPNLAPNQTEVVIEAGDQCWTSFQWMQDGKPERIEATLQAGDRFARVFDGEVKMVLGNAGGVKVLLNGQEARSIGQRGEVVKRTIVPGQLNEFFQEPAPVTAHAVPVPKPEEPAAVTPSAAPEAP